MRSLLAVLLCSALLGFAQGILDVGQCPEFSNIETFDVPPYLGRWFESQRFEAGFELGQTCVTADYGYLSPTMITVTNTANLPDGSLTSIVGNATATDTVGQLIVYFPGNGLGVYNVLDTDYETYSCVYACAQVGELREQFAWILSRTEELDADTLTAARAVYESNGIDVSFFQDTPQGGDCVYAPLPDGEDQ